MAYFDKNRPFEIRQGVDTSPSTPSARFSPLEWAVILSAQSDTVGSLKAPGRFPRAIGTVFGGGASSLLADARLESLRHLAVRAWHHKSLPSDELEDFFDAGFTPAHLSTLITSIDAAPPSWSALS